MPGIGSLGETLNMQSYRNRNLPEPAPVTIAVLPAIDRAIVFGYVESCEVSQLGNHYRRPHPPSESICNQHQSFQFVTLLHCEVPIQHVAFGVLVMKR